MMIYLLLIQDDCKSDSKHWMFVHVYVQVWAYVYIKNNYGISVTALRTARMLEAFLHIQ